MFEELGISFGTALIVLLALYFITINEQVRDFA